MAQAGLNKRTRFQFDWVVPLLGICLVLVAGYFASRFATERSQQEAKIEVFNALGSIRAKLEGSISHNLMLVHGLIALISADPDIDQQRFSQFARYVISDDNQLRNIAAAPDLVISMVYPLRGNESVLGLDYRRHPVQREAALRSMEAREIVIAGPVKLVQGGYGFIARLPVYLPDMEDPGGVRAWGLVSAVLDVDAIYQAAGLPDAKLVLAIRGQDAKGRQGGVFFGDPGLFDTDTSITLPVSLPSGSWQLAAQPREGWQRPPPMVWWIRGVTLFVALIIAVLGALWLRYQQERRQMEAEKQRLHRELLQAQKMESLGQLTGGVAHDFNNLLGVIVGFSDLALTRCRAMKEPKLADYLEKVRGAGERAAALVAQMLSFSRLDQHDNQPLRLHDLIEEDVRMLRSTLPSSIVIEHAIDRQMPAVRLNPTQLNQLLMNLATNGRDAMHGKGTLRIEYGWSRELHAECSACHKLLRGSWVELSVRDSGAGMDRETLKHAFNPFFTTKDVGKGTGMGLAVVYGIMRTCGGHILVDSVPTGGCRFRLLFPPAAGDATVREEAADTRKPSMGRGERILVVDDEPDLCDYLSNLLNANGYQVISTTDSKEALKLIAEEPARFALLLTDQTMPGTTGLELIAQARVLSRELPVVLCSGFSEQIDERALQAQGIHFLAKPVRREALLPSLRAILGARD